ncbi:hypothetical protein BWQ96_03321 [Gracilariopsis chorda]|uniref:Uncharacterized protein n=1 Tax=Gracilariopsis chorda TaxID=448386 RepID=A0A2V3IY42_9FLOR|nr:hypothetical protein BWQ96_03321 [Gracilariopsis chorda]|eukprot:PXF46983.1 hypothetical protein BWQ96_03321 [Gracilariopsis chorda]
MGEYASKISGFIAPSVAKLGADTTRRSAPASMCSKQAMRSVRQTRRRFLTTASLACLYATAGPQRAEALTTVTEALLELRAVREALETIVDLARDTKYDVLRLQLRAAPLNRIRAAGSVLYRGISDSEKRNRAEKAYKEVIQAVERADVTALRVSRGEIEEDVERLVQDVQKLVGDFIALFESE